MSRNKKTDPLGSNVGYGSGYIIQDYQVQCLEGRLLTLVESWGLRESQERAIKSQVRQEVWGLLSPCFIISDEDHTALRGKALKGEGLTGMGSSMNSGLANYAMPPMPMSSPSIVPMS